MSKMTIFEYIELQGEYAHVELDMVRFNEEDNTITVTPIGKAGDPQWTLKAQ